MKRMIKPIAIGLVMGIISAMAGPILMVGRLPYGDIALLGVFYIAIPSAISSLVLLIIPRIRLRLLPGIGIGLSLYFVLLMLGLGPADRLKRGCCHEAKVFCQSLIPLLEQYKSSHGAYPAQITDILPAGTQLPMYLRRQAFYRPQSNDFTFAWADSPGIPYCSGVAVYHHATSNWDFCADWGGIE